MATQLLDRNYWKPLWERVVAEPQPPSYPFHDLLRRREEIFTPPFDETLNAELARTRDNAAEAFLGRTAAAVVSETDRLWRTMVSKDWEERHRALEKAREHGSAPIDMHADDATLHENAEALVELGRDSEALPIYETLLGRDAKDARAAFHVGRILVERGDLAGVAHLSSAMQLDWRLGSARR